MINPLSRLARLGFTLIEMLVVLVIVSLTATLLMSGLSTTWQNFERLNSRDMTLSAGMIGHTWFRQSIEGAVMYHPYRSDFDGDSVSIRMTTFNAPFDTRQTPKQIVWRIDQSQLATELVIVDPHEGQSFVVDQFDSQIRFEYLHMGEWQEEFRQERNSLPGAIRIVQTDRELVRAYPIRPRLSDMPVEYPVFGVYEF